MMLSIFLTCLPSLAVLPAPPIQQVQGGVLEAQDEDPFGVIVEYYQPKKADVHILSDTMSRICRSGTISHKASAVNGGFITLQPEFLVYGETLLVTDTRTEMANTLALLGELDANYREAKPGPGGATEIELYAYSVTHVSMRTVQNPLNQLFQGQQVAGRGAPEPRPSISFVEENRQVLVRGTRAQIVAAMEVLKSLDVPQPRVMLSCYLISGAPAEENDDRVPADLVRDLSALVPYKGFELLSAASLPSDTNGRISLEVKLESGDGEMTLQMDPVAYDKVSGTLTLGDVRFYLSQGDGKQNNTKQFTTSTSLHQGEYTVLGSVGATPVFMVIKMTAGR